MLTEQKEKKKSKLSVVLEFRWLERASVRQRGAGDVCQGPMPTC